MLATTVYDSPDASYVYSISRSREALSAAGIPSAYWLLQGNCHVDDARNTALRDFLQSDCTDLVFLDADVSWEPDQLVQLCRRDEDIVGGVYPYRRDDGSDDMPLRMKRDCVEPAADGTLEVEGLPTGFMKIRRHVIEKMVEQAPKFRKGDGALIPEIFRRDMYGEGRRGGDIQFCMRWRERGGRIFALADMRLGHCGKTVIRDSLSASLRRQSGQTLRYVCSRIRERIETLDDLREAFRANENRWALPADILQVVIGLARKAAGPIIEMGSGFSTVTMAAATDQTVWCVEHDPVYAAIVERMARQAGVTNIAVVTANIVDGWYDLADVMDRLPPAFSMALVDGPPRIIGNRDRFFEVLGPRCGLIVCDDSPKGSAYAGKIEAWAISHGRPPVEFGDRAAVILK